jgi:hypothetical protein
VDHIKVNITVDWGRWRGGQAIASPLIIRRGAAGDI